MISSQFRFHGYGALKFLFGHGKTWRFSNMSVRVAPNDRREHSRVAVVISKKVIKAAPKRNRVRRRVYEVLRTNWSHIAPAHDILITIYDPSFWDAPASQVSGQIIHALQDAKLWVDVKKSSHQE